MDSSDTGILGLGSFDFTPDWAKREAGVSAGNFKQAKSENFSDRPARGNSREGGERGPRPGGAFRREDKREAKRDDRRDKNFAPRPKLRPLEAEVKILPETKALGTIMRKLQSSDLAYKLKDLAYFFLDNPEAVLLKITPKDQSEKFFTCKACSFAAKSKEEITEHIIASHLGDYYDSKEIEVEPPKGNFNCVAKCGLTGVLLGPPNVHEFNSVVREILRTKFPGMSESDYRAKIEMVRDSDAIENWRKNATKKTVYIVKNGGEDAPKLTREQAESEFRRNMLDSLVDEPKSLMITLAAALKCAYKPLVWAVRDQVQIERRSPYAMLFALRGAFHHRKMNLFRANDSRGPEFVCSRELKEFDATHAIAELAAVANFIKENPCISAAEICAALGNDAEKQLSWLVSTGHVVAFSNGVFSSVEKFPKYGPQWRKKKDKKSAASEAKSEKAAPNTEATAPKDANLEAPATTNPQAETAQAAEAQTEDNQARAEEVAPEPAEATKETISEEAK